MKFRNGLANLWGPGQPQAWGGALQKGQPRHLQEAAAFLGAVQPQLCFGQGKRKTILGLLPIILLGFFPSAPPEFI